MYDAIIIGSGFCGSTIAHLAATKLGKKVLIMERRNHIAGNMYDEKYEGGILVHKYGPHIFHTNMDEVYNFVIGTGKWKNFNLKCKAVIDGISTPTPFNFDTIDTFYEEEKARELKKRLLEQYKGNKSVPVVDLLKSKDVLIREYAEFLFEKDYKPYTAKQWGISPYEIDVSVLKRVPVSLSYNDQYFSDQYQIMPENGYTDFFNSLLNNDLIEVETNCNALERIEVNERTKTITFDTKEFSNPIIYTGAIDELFDYKYGKLPYRSLTFDYKTYNMKSYQDSPVVAYPQADKYTRITEYSKLPIQESEKTVIAIEYPHDVNSSANLEPYYPVPTDATSLIYNKYRKLANEYSNLYLCGRLAEYQYYNMDNAIMRAIETFNKIFEGE